MDTMSFDFDISTGDCEIILLHECLEYPIKHDNLHTLVLH